MCVQQPFSGISAGREATEGVPKNEDFPAVGLSHGKEELGTSRGVALILPVASEMEFRITADGVEVSESTKPSETQRACGNASRGTLE